MPLFSGLGPSLQFLIVTFSQLYKAMQISLALEISNPSITKLLLPIYFIGADLV
jgi:hypothetical protein